MMYDELFRSGFTGISLLCVAFLVICIIQLFRKDNESKNDLVCVLITAIVAITAYMFYVLSDSKFYATLFTCIYFVGTDWLAFFLLRFTVNYTSFARAYFKQFMIVLFAIFVVDSVGLITNPFHHKMFVLCFLNEPVLDYNFWGLIFFRPQYVHLLICYIPVFITFVLLCVAFYSAANIYRYKYIGIIIAYSLVIFVNLFCYTTNSFFDYSVLFYGFVAAFLCFYATSSFPKKLIRKLLRYVNEEISDGFVYYDVNGKCIYANKGAKRIFSDSKGFNKTLAEQYRTNWLSKSDGIEEEYSIDNISLFVCGKECQFVVEFQQEYLSDVYVGSYFKLVDKTKEMSDLRREQYKSTHDDLTGILNRAGFFECVDSFVNKFDADEMCMVCSNIKNFKLINELFGDKTGDDLIKNQATILKVFCGPSSIYGRIADDKYALFLPKRDFTEKKVERFLALMRNSLAGRHFDLRIILGVYEPVGKKESASVMYDKALMALSKISNDYTRVCSYYDSNFMDSILKEKNISDEFEQALKKNQIQMYVQPLKFKKSNKIAVEALARWNHPVRGMLYPADFIPVLEKTMVIYKLDQFIWTEAIKAVHLWKEKFGHDIAVSINVSEKDFYYIDIFKVLTELTKKYDVSPKLVYIELTEAALMADFERSKQLSAALKSKGFNITIDNFGNGYSSLNMLKDFNADVIKIDMSFIREIEEKKRSRVILGSIIEMADSLGMSSVIQGVEEKEQYTITEEVGCKIIQGFYISRPVDVKTFEETLQKNHH